MVWKTRLHYTKNSRCFPKLATSVLYLRRIFTHYSLSTLQHLQIEDSNSPGTGLQHRPTDFDDFDEIDSTLNHALIVISCRLFSNKFGDDLPQLVQTRDEHVGFENELLIHNSKFTATDAVILLIL